MRTIAREDGELAELRLEIARVYPMSQIIDAEDADAVPVVSLISERLHVADVIRGAPRRSPGVNWFRRGL